jgi:hypothetical protein
MHSNRDKRVVPLSDKTRIRHEVLSDLDLAIPVDERAFPRKSSAQYLRNLLGTVAASAGTRPVMPPPRDQAHSLREVVTRLPRARVRACETAVTIRGMANHGRCTASLSNGQRCRVVIERVGADFCPHHLKLAEEHGDETVKNGKTPKQRALRVVEEPVAVVTTVARVMPTSVIGPANVRPMLAEAAAENAEKQKTSLLEAAGSAVRQVWLTVECSNCGERSRVEGPVPDVRSRVAAIELLLREGLGRPPQAEETHAPRLPSSAEAVEKMSWTEMKAVFAASFVTCHRTRRTGALRRHDTGSRSGRSPGKAKSDVSGHPMTPSRLWKWGTHPFRPSPTFASPDAAVVRSGAENARPPRSAPDSR